MDIHNRTPVGIPEDRPLNSVLVVGSLMERETPDREISPSLSFCFCVKCNRGCEKVDILTLTGAVEGTRGGWPQCPIES